MAVSCLVVERQVRGGSTMSPDAPSEIIPCDRSWPMIFKAERELPLRALGPWLPGGSSTSASGSGRGSPRTGDRHHGGRADARRVNACHRCCVETRRLRLPYVDAVQACRRDNRGSFHRTMRCPGRCVGSAVPPRSQSTRYPPIEPSKTAERTIVSRSSRICETRARQCPSSASRYDARTRGF